MAVARGGLAGHRRVAAQRGKGAAGQRGRKPSLLLLAARNFVLLIVPAHRNFMFC